VQLFEALAPLRVMKLERVSIDSPLVLGSPELEALVHSLGDSIETLYFCGCILESSFWRPLAQQLPRLQYLTLDHDDLPDLIFFLGVLSGHRHRSLPLSISIGELALGTARFAELEAHIAAWQLDNIHLTRY
jgi:hypothetical protein